MAHHQRSRRLYMALIVLLLCFSAVDAFGRNRKERQLEEELEEDDDDDLDTTDISVHFLVEFIGKQIYERIKKRKYKLIVYMTIGKLPSERSTIALLSTICNVLYGCCIWFGFIFIRRDYMLIGTLLTLHIGPAMILILIGLIGMTLAAFALYPVSSVAVMWLFFLLTSQIAQAFGRYLGLDSDKDGDVDYLDLIHWAASTRLGRLVGMPALYEILNKINQDPFQEIHRRLDTISEHIDNNKMTAHNNNNSSDSYPEKSSKSKAKKR